MLEFCCFAVQSDPGDVFFTVCGTAAFVYSNTVFLEGECPV